jgi:hypothetical protein
MQRSLVVSLRCVIEANINLIVDSQYITCNFAIKFRIIKFFATTVYNGTINLWNEIMVAEPHHFGDGAGTRAESCYGPGSDSTKMIRLRLRKTVWN